MSRCIETPIDCHQVQVLYCLIDQLPKSKIDEGHEWVDAFPTLDEKCPKNITSLGIANEGQNPKKEETWDSWWIL